MKPGNILHIKSLSKDWCDKNLALLHACFQLLEDCVEEERLLDGPFVDWDATAKDRDDRRRLKELYDWWKARKQQSIEYDGSEPDVGYFQEENRRLKELIDLRHRLWT